MADRHGKRPTAPWLRPVAMPMRINGEIVLSQTMVVPDVRHLHIPHARHHSYMHDQMSSMRVGGLTTGGFRQRADRLKAAKVA